MKFFRSLLLGASLASFFVYALPLPPESGIAERENTELLPRGKLFADHGSYNKQKAVAFVKNIPLEKLGSLGNTVDTLHSVDDSGRVAKKNSKPTSGFRLDNQGTTGSGDHNLQVQINGPRKGKSTVGGILLKGDMRPKDIRKHLVHAVMHPNRDSKGNEYLQKHEGKDGKAPTDSAGRKLSNAEARKSSKPRQKVNPKSKKNRKAARKASYQE